MGGVRPNRKAARHSRRAYLCVSAIRALNPTRSIAAFARPGAATFSDNYLNRLQPFGDLSSEAIS
jgi:hypothetical protein